MERFFVLAFGRYFCFTEWVPFSTNQKQRTQRVFIRAKTLACSERSDSRSRLKNWRGEGRLVLVSPRFPPNFPRAGFYSALLNAWNRLRKRPLSNPFAVAHSSIIQKSKFKTKIIKLFYPIQKLYLQVSDAAFFPGKLKALRTACWLFRLLTWCVTWLRLYVDDGLTNASTKQIIRQYLNHRFIHDIVKDYKKTDLHSTKFDVVFIIPWSETHWDTKYSTTSSSLRKRTRITLKMNC